MKNSPSAGAGASDSSTMVNEDYNEWEDHITPVRPLRQWSRSQLTPYTAEKFNHKRALQGKLERDGDFHHNAHPGGSNRCLTGMSVSRRGPPQANLTPAPLTPSRSKDATQEKVIKQTRLNTRLTTALNGVFEVVYLEDAPEG